MRTCSSSLKLSVILAGLFERDDEVETGFPLASCLKRIELIEAIVIYVRFVIFSRMLAPMTGG